MNKACVIGLGTVGKATAEAFGIKHYYSRSKGNITLEESRGFRYIFICLPTPTVGGKNYVQDIIDVIKKIKSYPGEIENIFIIRSTVRPGFNKLLQETFGTKNFVNNPEFLSDDTAIADAKNPDIVVLGSDDVTYANEVKAYYRGRFRVPPILVTDSITAELIKYTLNTFFTTKVIFANEIYDYAQQIGANYQVVKSVLEDHKWGSKNHFTIHYKNRRGVHGKCLPKDTEAFANLTGSPFFEMLLERNEVFKDGE